MTMTRGGWVADGEAVVSQGGGRDSDQVRVRHY
jgi:hypothetical protein